MLLKLMSRTSTISSYFSVKNFLQMPSRVVVQAAEQLGVHAGHAGRRFAQPFAIGVFAHGRENLAHRAVGSAPGRLAASAWTPLPSSCSSGMLSRSGASVRTVRDMAVYSEKEVNRRS